MDLMPAEIQQYAERHSLPESDLLQKIRRETHLYELKPRMLSGRLQGGILYFLCQMIQPKNVLEIGTFTGYATISMVSALPAGGKIWTIDVNEELETRVRGYFSEHPSNDKIEFLIGDAQEIIPGLEPSWDLAFIDADKKSYTAYYELILERMGSGGFIVADNVLWDGKVADASKTDKDTDSIRAFNRHVQKDSRVENVLFPVRDGLMVIRKR